MAGDPIHANPTKTQSQEKTLLRSYNLEKVSGVVKASKGYNSSEPRLKRQVEAWCIL